MDMLQVCRILFMSAKVRSLKHGILQNTSWRQNPVHVFESVTGSLHWICWAGRICSLGSVLPTPEGADITEEDATFLINAVMRFLNVQSASDVRKVCTFDLVSLISILQWRFA